MTGAYRRGKAWKTETKKRRPSSDLPLFCLLCFLFSEKAALPGVIHGIGKTARGEIILHHIIPVPSGKRESEPLLSAVQHDPHHRRPAVVCHALHPIRHAVHGRPGHAQELAVPSAPCPDKEIFPRRFRPSLREVSYAPPHPKQSRFMRLSYSKTPPL